MKQQSSAEASYHAYRKFLPSRDYFELFLVSFLVLFLELTCIRWFASYVVFLTFFTNIVLLASFLGIGVGCLAASRGVHFVNWLPPLTCLAIASAASTPLLYQFGNRIVVQVESHEMVYFGAEYGRPDIAAAVIPIEFIAGFFFVVIAVIFIGPGQIMGRKMDQVSSRVLGYMTNIAGSIIGILGFSLVSALRLSPVWWFGVALGGICYFLTGRRRIANYGYALTAIIIVGFLGSGIGRKFDVYWSPYSQISYDPKVGSINSNNIAHQYMVSRKDTALAYPLPYLLSGSVDRAPIKDVLVIGAGSGNDVSAALSAGAQHIDAVEVDPVIHELGRRFHPDRPYQDPRVRVHIDDGRNFLRKSTQKYDLIVYALVDSLVLHSGYSSIRLESFLFTREAFADIKARLKENGIFVAYNFFRQGWIIARLAQMAEEVFGRKPLVFSLPHRTEIDLTTAGGFTMILVGDTDSITQAFNNYSTYRVPTSNLLDGKTSQKFAPGGRQQSTAVDFVEIGPAVVKAPRAAFLAEDDWPFLYLREPLIPAQTMRGIIMIAVLSLIILALFAPTRTGCLNWSMFFLGAGFMLLETKGVVQMALLFGSTWTVNAIVFVAILSMVLLSNLFVLRFNPGSVTIYYVALLTLLGLNAVVDLGYFLGLPQVLRAVGSCLLLFLPVFFAGVIFATNFGKGTNPDVDLGSNIAGVVLGGIAENVSLILGFRHLMFIAILFYFLARSFQPRFSLGTR